MIKLPFSNSLYFKNRNYYTNNKNHFQANCKQNNTSIPLLSETKYEDNNKSSDFVLDILGFKLQLDDIIILGLLYFLYSEGVKDDFLYGILFLLLFS